VVAGAVALSDAHFSGWLARLAAIVEIAIATIGRKIWGWGLGGVAV
jgi:hypothetical protein